MKKLLSIFLICILIFGMCAWFGGFLIAFRAIDYTGELPLAGIQGVAIDTFGNIYTESDFYGKVQIYDSTGRFLRSWNVPASGGGIVFYMDQDEQLVLETSKSHAQYIYTRDGRQVSNRIANDSDFNSGKPYTTCCFHDKCYALNGFFFATINRISPTKAIVVNQSFFLKIVSGNFVWLFFITGAFGLVFLNRKKIALRSERRRMGMPE